MLELNGYDALFAVLGLALSVWHRFFIMEKMKAFRPVLALIAARCEQKGVIAVEAEIQRTLGSAWASFKCEVVVCYGGMLLYTFLFTQSHERLSAPFLNAAQLTEVCGLVFCLVRAAIDPSFLEE